MSTPQASVPPIPPVKAPKPKGPPRPKGPHQIPGSREAKRLAAGVLEVLAGARLPSEAASGLHLSVPRYYLLETRALSGLVAALEPRPLGRVVSPQAELDRARKELARLRQDCARYQALARVAQRTLGLQPQSASPPKPDARGRVRKKRTPTRRALKAAEFFRKETAEAPLEAVPVAVPS